MITEFKKDMRFIANGKGRKVYRVQMVRPKSVTLLQEDTNEEYTISLIESNIINRIVAEVL